MKTNCRKIYLPDRLIELEKFRDLNENFINIYSLYGESSDANELLIDKFKYSSSIEEHDADLNALLDDVQKEKFSGYFILVNSTSSQFKQFMDSHLFSELVKLNNGKNSIVDFFIFDILKNQIETKHFLNETKQQPEEQQETILFIYDHYDLAKLKNYKLERSIELKQPNKTAESSPLPLPLPSSSYKNYAKLAFKELFKFCCETSELMNSIAYFARSLKSLLTYEDGSPLKQRARLFRMAANFILGIIVTGFILYNPYFKGYYDSFNFLLINYMEIIMNHLTNLINWLMGVPVGLKLNKPLNDFLGRFFMYHIYLWNSSLEVSKELLPNLFNFFIYSGLFGLSAQLSLLTDAFKLFTIHKYCFYIYAVRIYKLEIESFKSLFRLFRGKKLNPLRSRIDSYLYDVDQLFIGTLAFCLVFFLLPTVLLYYVVFLMLRIVILLVDGFINQLIKMINHLPVYEMLIFTFGCSSAPHCIEYKFKSDIKSTNKINVLEIKMKSKSFGELLKKTECEFFKFELKSLKEIFANILNGSKI